MWHKIESNLALLFDAQQNWYSLSVDSFEINQSLMVNKWWHKTRVQFDDTAKWCRLCMDWFSVSTASIRLFIIIFGRWDWQITNQHTQREVSLMLVYIRWTGQKFVYSILSGEHNFANFVWCDVPVDATQLYSVDWDRCWECRFVFEDWFASENILITFGSHFGSHLDHIGSFCLCACVSIILKCSLIVCLNSIYSH